MEREETRGGQLAWREPVTVAIRTLEGAMLRLRHGHITGDEFRPTRTILGVYGQRQPEEYMVRVRIPGGRLTSPQLRTLAQAARDYGNGTAHITTRQNVQLHWLSLDRMPSLLRSLAAAGLATLQTGGNSVRTVGACPLAGACPKEQFDVTPHAEALDAYCLGNPSVMALPRKVKTAFSGCAQDCSVAVIQDVGAVAVTRQNNGGVERGFQLFVAGGLGVFPRQGQLLEAFVPEGDLLQTFQAVVRTFDRLGERRNKQRARLKFLVNRLGMDEFRRLVAEENARGAHVVRAEGGSTNAAPAPEQERLDHDRSRLVQSPPQSPDTSPVAVPAKVPGATYEQWLQWNVTPESQSGLFSLAIPLKVGDISSDQMEAVADLADWFGRSEIRTSQQQNMVLQHVPDNALTRVYEMLSGSGLASCKAGGIGDVTSCPGTSACSLAIAGSRPLAEHLTNLLSGPSYQEDEALNRLRVKVSGCPDGCAQHHLADIGLQGCALHQDGRLYPAYQLLLGGHVSETGTRFAQPAIKIPARRVPQAVALLVRTYRVDRRERESFPAFVDRLGLKYFHELLSSLTRVPGPDQAPTLFTDWGGTELYVLARGEGECGV